ncbi:hypothetical protein E8701_RS25655, partial [Escherichia coli]
PSRGLFYFNWLKKLSKSRSSISFAVDEYFISEKIVYDRKNLHIMIRVVTLPRSRTRRCAGFFVPRIL